MTSFQRSKLLLVGLGVVVLAAAFGAYADVENNIAFARLKSDQNGAASLRGEMPATGSLVSGLDENWLVHKSLTKNVLDPLALSDLVMAKTGRESGKAAAKSRSLIGTVSRRSHKYLIQELAAAADDQDLERAVVTLDRLASLEPSMRKDIFPVLTNVLDKPGGEKLIAMRQSRQWFTAFIASATRDPNTVSQIAEFLLDHPPVDLVQRKNQLQLVLGGLIAQNEVGQAQAVALKFGQIQKSDLNSLDWLKTEVGTKSLPLAWQFPNPQAQPTNVEKQQLQLAFDGQPGSKPIAEKFLTIPPGAYELSSKFTFATGHDIELVWKIRCGSLPVRQMTNTQSMNTPGSAVTILTFEAKGPCPGYRLSLYALDSMGRYQKRIVGLAPPTLTRVR